MEFINDSVLDTFFYCMGVFSCFLALCFALIIIVMVLFRIFPSFERKFKNSCLFVIDILNIFVIPFISDESIISLDKGLKIVEERTSNPENRKSMRNVYKFLVSKIRKIRKI